MMEQPMLKCGQCFRDLKVSESLGQKCSRSPQETAEPRDRSGIERKERRNRKMGGSQKRSRAKK